MTVAELIKQLEYLPQDALIAVINPYIDEDDLSTEIVVNYSPFTDTVLITGEF